jgi:hypothetical protein
MAKRVITADGRLVTGYKVKETAEEVQLRDPSTQKAFRIARKNVEEMGEIRSLMTEGLTAAMTSEELQDLIRALSELGRKPEK